MLFCIFMLSLILMKQIFFLEGNKNWKLLVHQVFKKYFLITQTKDGGVCTTITFITFVIKEDQYY